MPPAPAPWMTTVWSRSFSPRIRQALMSPASATVDQSLDVGIVTPVFTQDRIDAGAPVGRDNYQVRTASHADGHVYVAFYRRKAGIAIGYNADVVVVRDDDWGKAVPPFQGLVDTRPRTRQRQISCSTARTRIQNPWSQPQGKRSK